MAVTAPVKDRDKDKKPSAKEAAPLLPVKSSLSKAQKAALIFLFLEEKGAASLFNHMSDEEVKMIGQTLVRMNEIPMEELTLVLNEFYESLGSPIPNAFSGRKIFERLVEKSIPQERRGRIFSVDDVRGGRGSIHNPLETMFVSATPEHVFQLVQEEHPQTVAVVLTLIPPLTSRQVLLLFDDQFQSDILYRMSMLSSIHEDVIRLLEGIYREKFAAIAASGGFGASTKEMVVPGIEVVLKFLRALDWVKADGMIENIEKVNTEVARILRKKVFTMEDLARTDNNGVRSLLKNVETGDLAIALKGASGPVQNLFFQNMSTRAATILREDMEIITHKPEDIELAVERILNEAKNLIRDGEMTLEQVKELY